MPRAAKTPSSRSASWTAVRHESMPDPTAITRVTPASRARRSTSAGSTSPASRCACVSIMPDAPDRPKLPRGRAELRPGLAPPTARAFPGLRRALSPPGSYRRRHVGNVAGSCGSLHPLELLALDLLRVELAEEGPRLEQLLAGRQLARLPRADPGVVVAGEHDV